MQGTSGTMHKTTQITKKNRGKSRILFTNRSANFQTFEMCYKKAQFHWMENLVYDFRGDIGSVSRAHFFSPERISDDRFPHEGVH